MAIGYLIVQVQTAQEAVPLAGVQVSILDSHGSVVYDLTTDESGETLKVPLETLDKSFSQNQYFMELPYKSYNVLVRETGFNTVYVSDIPIYEGETALLPLELVPMQQMQRRPQQTRIFVGQPAVASRTPRNQEGTTDSARILRQVVIPNPITVHLGAPVSSASNVQVSFPDYVKNAASSEIYPTWPEAALTANIYAIITFALNRIFTEWYRNRGYNYDITNSTAYDQAFIPGRPIYESISRIVDNIFNEFVRRPSQDAPFFTSFCNGTTVTCRGLSQWGTVTLANQGRTPLQILRTYYPQDVEISSTNTITGVLSSYPGTPLKQGSTGLDVQTIQTYLGRIRRNYPAIPVITDPAGTFGDSTKAAVTKFQSVFGLSPDGIVGKSTWYKISGIYAAITRLAELDSEGTSLGIGTVPPSSILRQGSKSPDVITLQYLLNMAALFYPGIPAPAQDGVFGPGTRQAVTAFQQAVGITPDGIVGPLTWKNLYEVYFGIGQNVPFPGPQPGVREYVVQPGDSLWLIAKRYGTTVEALKQLNGLTSDLLNIGQVLKIPADTDTSYFEYTVRAGDTLWLLSRRFDTTVEAIQKLNGLSGDNLSIGQVLKIPSR